MEQNQFSNFGRGSFKEYFYEITLKLGHWPMSRKSFSTFSSGGHFVQPSRTILAYLVEGHPRNISVKLFENWSTGLGVDIKDFSILDSGSHLVYLSGQFYLFWYEITQHHS